MDVDYEVDVDEINQRWAVASDSDAWSQLILKDTRDTVELLTQAPQTGIWRLEDDGSMSFARWGHDWHSLHDDREAFFLRVLGAGDYTYPGADLGVLVSRSRMQDDALRLTPLAQAWIKAVHGRFAGMPLAPQEEQPPHRALAFKSA
jgi:hypothetical protein